MAARKDLDFILDTYMGQFNLLHWEQYFICLFLTFACTVPFYLHLFAAHTPAHRCQVPICDDTAVGSSYNESFVAFTIPKSRGEFLLKKQFISQCDRFKSRQGAEDCNVNSFNTNETEQCQQYVYDKSIFAETLTTRLNLVCDKEYQSKLFNTVVMIGLLIGCIVGGPIGDMIGRKAALTLSYAVMGPSVVLGGFVYVYEVYLLLRLVTYVAIGTVWINSHAMILELFGTKRRKVAYVVNSIFYSVSPTFLSVVAYLERNWSYMHLWVGLVVMIALPLTVFRLNESLRWLAINKRQAKALKLIKIYSNCSQAEEEEIKEILETMSGTSESTLPRMSVLYMFKQNYLFTTIILAMLWIIGVVSYYAIAFNATNMAGDMFLNFSLTSLADIPSTVYLYLLVDFIGRRKSIAAALTILGIVTFIMAFIPKDMSTVAIRCLFITGKVMSSAVVNVIWLFTAELYPTNLRAQAVGTLSLISRIFGMGAPYVEYLGGYWQPLPFLILGTPAFIGAGLCFLLEETAGKPLKEDHHASKRQETLPEESPLKTLETPS